MERDGKKQRGLWKGVAWGRLCRQNDMGSQDP